MKNVLRLFAPFALVLLFAVSSNAQSSDVANLVTTPATKTTKCKAMANDSKSCDPAECAKLVAQGKCTKTQMAACQAKCKSASNGATSNQRAHGLTKVASASVEKGTEKAATKSACSKVCGSKKKANKE